MGASLAVPFVTATEWPAPIHALKAAGLHVFALTPAQHALPLHLVSAAMPRVALLLGGEGVGLSREALDAADAVVRIVTTDKVDSLNVATAAAIALHHFAVARV